MLSSSASSALVSMADGGQPSVRIVAIAAASGVHTLWGESTRLNGVARLYRAQIHGTRKLGQAREHGKAPWTRSQRADIH